MLSGVLVWSLSIVVALLFCQAFFPSILETLLHANTNLNPVHVVVSGGGIVYQDFWVTNGFMREMHFVTNVTPHGFEYSTYWTTNRLQ